MMKFEAQSKHGLLSGVGMVEKTSAPRFWDSDFHLSALVAQLGARLGQVPQEISSSQEFVMWMEKNTPQDRVCLK